MPDREVRYCTTRDGLRIAYSVEGDPDLPPVVWVPGWISHLEIDGSRRDSAGVTDILKPVRFVTLDKRGSGLSSRDVDDFSQDARIADLATVVDDVGFERFALAGSSEGGPVAMGFAARFPDRVTHLVIYGSFANPGGIAGSETMRQALLTIVKEEWGIASKLMSEFFVNGDSYITPDEFAAYQRLAANPPEAYATFAAIMVVNVQAQLSAITAPTLVIHARDDRIVSPVFGQEIAAGIRGARFISLPGAHLPAPEQWRSIYAAAVDFVTGVAHDVPNPSFPPAQSDTGSLRVVLFTDLVGHTQMMSRLGDEAGRATKAVECAIALQRALDERNSLLSTQHSPLSVRVGLNAGEPIEEDGDLFGATVILASRIAAKAEGGEILVSDNVRSLCSGKNFLFAGRGEFEAKGIEDPVRVYEVNWRA